MPHIVGYVSVLRPIRPGLLRIYRLNLAQTRRAFSMISSSPATWLCFMTNFPSHIIESTHELSPA